MKYINNPDRKSEFHEILFSKIPSYEHQTATQNMDQIVEEGFNKLKKKDTILKAFFII